MPSVQAAAAVDGRASVTSSVIAGRCSVNVVPFPMALYRATKTAGLLPKATHPGQPGRLAFVLGREILPHARP
jgi:hypothetical protein